MKTIHQLRKDGYKVRVNHFRFLVGNSGATPLFEIRQNQNQSSMLPKGGITRMQVRLPEGKEVEVEAICNKIDGFNRKLAIRICLGRISKQLGIN